MRAVFGKKLLLLFLGGGNSLRRLGLGEALLEFVHTAGGVHKLLRAGVKRMASVANTDDDGGLGGAGLDHIAAGATDFRVHVFRMNICFHKRPRKVSRTGGMTRMNFICRRQLRLLPAGIENRTRDLKSGCFVDGDAFSLCASVIKNLMCGRFVRWCNGNTAPFGGVIHGSNPCRTATSSSLYSNSD